MIGVWFGRVIEQVSCCLVWDKSWTTKGSFQISMIRPPGSEKWFERYFQPWQILVMIGWRKGSFIWVSNRAPKRGFWLLSQSTKGFCLSESFRSRTFQKKEFDTHWDGDRRSSWRGGPRAPIEKEVCWEFGTSWVRKGSGGLKAEVFSVRGRKRFCEAKEGVWFEIGGGERVGEERERYSDGRGVGSGEEKIQEFWGVRDGPGGKEDGGSLGGGSFMTGCYFFWFFLENFEGVKVDWGVWNFWEVLCGGFWGVSLGLRFSLFLVVDSFHVSGAGGE